MTIDLLGSAAFVPVQKDLTGNIAKIATRLEADPTNSATLEGMLAKEKEEKVTVATQALLWLLRGLEFTMLALKRNVEDPNEELATSFSKSYEGTLRAFHSFVVRPVFAVRVLFTQSRAILLMYHVVGNEGLPLSQDLLREARLSSRQGSRGIEKVVGCTRGHHNQIESFVREGGLWKGTLK